MRVLLAVTDPLVEAPVLRRLARADAGVTVVRRCVDLADLLAAGSSTAADAVVVASSVRHLDRDAVATLHRQGLLVVLVTDVPPSGGPDGADPAATAWRRLGADAVVGADPEEVLQGLRSPAAPSSGEASAGGAFPLTRPGDGRQPGRLVAVWGPTGAPGRTTVAVTVADESARLGVPTLLADADTYGASVAVQLGLLDDLSGLAAACRAAGAGRLEPEGLARTAVSLRSGLRVLSGLPRSDRWGELRPAALDEVWNVARATVDLTVVDCGFGLHREPETQFDPTLPVRDGATLATVAAADTVLCVGRVDPVGLVRLLRELPALREAAPTAHLVGVLVSTGRGRGAEAEARRLLAERVGLTDVVTVPDDREAVEAAHWAGASLAEAAPGSPARKALAALAARSVGVTPRRARRVRLRRSA